MFTIHVYNAFKRKKLDLEYIQQNQLLLYLDIVSPLEALLHDNFYLTSITTNFSSSNENICKFLPKI